MHSRLVTTLALLCFLVASCTTGSPRLREPDGDPNQAGLSEPLTIVDSRGRTVQLDQPPDRMLVSGKANIMISEALYLFEEASEHMPALPRAGQRQANGESFLSLVDPAYHEKPQFQWSASAEQLASFDPSIVLLKSFMADQVGEALEAVGIPVAYVDFETPEQYARDLGILAQLLEEEERLGEILSYYESMERRVAQEVSELDEDERPGVLLLQYSEKGGEVAFNVPPLSWMQTTLVEKAGGRPVWTAAAQGKGWTVVGFEQIAAWEPDKIFVVNYFSDVDDVVARLTANPQWQSLTPVKQGELYGFPKDYYSWDQPDPRWILGLTWLAKTTHPSRFTDLDMEEEVVTFFREMYGMEEATIEESILPRLEGDWR